MTEAELVILEFDQIGGRDTMEEYFEVGFFVDVRVDFAVDFIVVGFGGHGFHGG